jgi:O-acetyl-ADP-ribose deacetylase (regulator of RNase III)
MPSINYVQGDATSPIGEGIKIIAHICNDVGAWGAGFVLAISSRWVEPEQRYHVWHSNQSFKLGNIQVVKVNDDTYVANMIAQHGVGFYQGPPIRYPALRQCLMKLYRESRRMEASVHMPRIGCGLAGGEWDKVKEIIYDELVDKGVEVTVYDLA